MTFLQKNATLAKILIGDKHVSVIFDLTNLLMKSGICGGSSVDFAAKKLVMSSLLIGF